MGRTLLILLTGFAASFGVLAMSKNQRFADSLDRMVKQVADYSAKNASTSGVQKALNQLYLNPAWRGSYNNLAIAGGTANITVVNDSADGDAIAHQIKILSSSANTLTQVIVFDSEFQEFAVWAKDSVNLLTTTTQDSNGVGDSDLLMQNAPFMPKIDKDALLYKAVEQGNVYDNGGEPHFHPLNGFPYTGGFYVDSTAVPKVANVIHVEDDLHVKDDRTVYGIFIVEGDVLLSSNAHIKGVIYLPNASSRVYNHSSMVALESGQVTGGIVTWGEIDFGAGRQLIVRHKPEFLRTLVSNYADNNPPIRVLTWK
jgi:hypothetical protein